MILTILFRYSTETVMENIDQSIVTWLITLICAPHLIKNPYITAKLVEVLFITSPTIQQSTKPIYTMVNIKHNMRMNSKDFFIKTYCLQIMNHELAQTVLASSLMKFYTDIETTGQSTEFYDKFTIRYSIMI